MFTHTAVSLVVDVGERRVCNWLIGLGILSLCISGLRGRWLIWIFGLDLRLLLTIFRHFVMNKLHMYTKTYNDVSLVVYVR